jgi:hypothetical protein
MRMVNLISSGCIRCFFPLLLYFPLSSGSSRLSSSLSPLYQIKISKLDSVQKTLASNSFSLLEPSLELLSPSLYFSAYQTLHSSHLASRTSSDQQSSSIDVTPASYSQLPHFFHFTRLRSGIK